MSIFSIPDAFWGAQNHKMGFFIGFHKILQDCRYPANQPASRDLQLKDILTDILKDILKDFLEDFRKGFLHIGYPYVRLVIFAKQKSEKVKK